MSAACAALMVLLTATPGRAQIWDPNTVDLTLRELAPSVYAVVDSRADEGNPQGQPLATSGGFIIGERGVLVVESMINSRLAGQLLSHIRRVTDKPIRYVVNTSYHGDHSYGNYIMPDAALIVQHERTREYIAESFSDDVAFMIQNFGARRGMEEVIPRSPDIIVGGTDDLVIDLGGKTVEIKYFGFAQTDGDIFVWLPTEQVFFTGNPVIAEPPSIPWLLDGRHAESLETMKAIRAFLPEDATVVPGHGRPVRPSDLDFTIEYLEALDASVREAIAEGLSEQQAVERVKLPDFQGYAIFDWVHSQVNVPAAYRALKGR
jgi:glyoxylase-like metal-dependent hydrolase (beta-lactamase superfamily II)